MRESFVFHFEYLEDIPAELQAEWAMMVINYARDGSEPELDDWRDVRMWNRIKDRIDADRMKYEKRCNNLRNFRRNQEAKPSQEVKSESEKVEAPKPTEPETSEPAPAETKATGEAPKKEPAKFVKPTAGEVKDYIREKKFNVDAEKFIAYYESNGWKVGRNPMKNWKAAVSSWAHNGYDTGQKPGTIWGNENEVPEEIANML